MRLALALCASIPLLAACAPVSTSPGQPSGSGGGITTLPVTTQVPSPSPSGAASPSTSTGSGQINADSLISTIEQQYSQNYGTTITLTCPRSGTFTSTPGDTFQCNFTDANANSGTMTVSITSGQGDFSWTIP